ncbi:MAG: hypothetical protein S4CHLAM45_05130 [Chlamydiales bacterium]|nr:hypothetical protein [Chlamydiales bacterium]MCH9619946.1 hypothetical protein [Chlamydiales bacterium]MCH9622627.1 hypothetical protein [Chlamydiales bacterium]
MEVSIVNEWNTINVPEATRNYNKQRSLATTLVAIGIILSLASLVAAGFTAGIHPAYPVLFVCTAIGGIVIALSPLRLDWTPYHTEAFHDQVAEGFKTFNTSEEYFKFIKTFDFSKLEGYGYIANTVTEKIRTASEGDASDETFCVTQLGIWNGQFSEKA